MNISETRLAVFLGGMALALVVAGCASTGAVKKAADTSMEEGPPAAVEAEKEVPVTVDSLSVVGEGDRVMISATGPVKYTVFRLSDPERLIVDMPGVSLEGVTSPLTVNNNYITEITSTTYGEGDSRIGRIVIGLRDGVDHEVRSGEDSILVELKREIFISGFSADSAGYESSGEETDTSAVDTPAYEKTPMAAETEQQLAGNDTAPVEEAAAGAGVEHLMGDIGVVELKPEQPSLDTAAEAQAATPVEEAKSLLEINSFDEDGTTVVKVRADGALINYNSFELSDPARLVVDLLGVESSIGRYRVPVESPYIEDVRVGRHPDKTRLVFDSKQAAMIPHVIKREGDALVFRFGLAVRDDTGPVAADTKGGGKDLGAFESGTQDSAVNDEGVMLAATVDMAPAGGNVDVPTVASKNEEAPAVVDTENTRPAETAAQSQEVQTQETAPETRSTGDIAPDTADTTPQASSDEPLQETADSGSAQTAAAEEPAQAAPESISPQLAEKTMLEVPAAPASTEGGEGFMVASIPADMAPADDSQADSNEASVEAADTDTQNSKEVLAQQEPAPSEAVDEPAATEEAQAQEQVQQEPQTQEQTPAVEEEPSTEIVKVDFRKLKDMARLLVKGSEKLSYSIDESKDGRRLIIDIKNAVLPDELRRILDARKLDTPVLTISSYQAAIEPVKEVRVVVKLRDKVDYVVDETDGAITVDFPVVEPEPVEAVRTHEEKHADGAGEKKKYTGRRIDLDMVDAEITDVLKLLAEVSDLNIIAGDDVKGKITMRLKNVPWDQAFDIILQTKGLDKVQVGNVIRVAPAAKIRQEKEAMLAAKKAKVKLEELSIEFVSINYATAADLEDQVKGVLTERGSVSSDARTNTLIIKDVKRGIEAAKHLIAELDKPIPQVHIEARIVEAESTFARDLGIQWGLTTEGSGDGWTASMFGSMEDTTMPGAGTKNFAVNMPASGTAGTLGAVGFSFGKLGITPVLLDLRLSAGESEGLVKTISRPRITTMDNKEAKIEQGESIPFETTSAAGTQTTFVDANLSLTVTPHITPDGSVLMKIKAARNSIGSFTTAAGEPSINRKEASTEVLVKDGETTVMGGIVISDTSDTEKGIPFLKKIPILGWLFKNRSLKDTQTELLIFITPTIIKDKDRGMDKNSV